MKAVDYSGRNVHMLRAMDFKQATGDWVLKDIVMLADFAHTTCFVTPGMRQTHPT
jgi:hypothetical protein